MPTGTFYEDDEPLEELLAAFDAGEQGVTAPRERGRTEFFRLSSVEFEGQLVGNATRAS